MTRKRVGQGLVEAFSTPCECCNGRGFIVHNDPVAEKSSNGKKESSKKAPAKKSEPAQDEPENDPEREQLKATLQTIAAATTSAQEEDAKDSEDKSS